jgi:lysophospholipase L1-like esterase
VQDAANSVKAKYVSLINPNVIDLAMILPDKVHVNDAGHKAIAERVLAALR